MIWLAEMAGAPVGVGRLIDMPPAAELGGMYVDPAWRGRGLAQCLLAALCDSAGGRGVYCLPFAHLDRLYRAFGFAEPPPGLDIPPTIRAKHAWCAAQYDAPVILLYRADTSAE